MNKNSPAIPQKFEASSALQESITRANDAYIDLFLTAARYRAMEPLASFLLGIDDDILAKYSRVSKADLVSAAMLGAPLFVPRFSDAATIRALLSSGFRSTAVHQALTSTFPLNPASATKSLTINGAAVPQKFEACRALQDAIKKANEAFIDFLLTAALSKSMDPLASFLLGICDETLDEYTRVSRADLVSAAMLGAPLFVPRFSDAATIKELLTTGFQSAVVQQELTKTMSLGPVPARKNHEKTSQ
ncbi:hypothetical protein LP417_35285 (plasmid) [Polaromonas sp. P1-6]|nr:hypothetical protein LP417_35285 [Polaromonas sp. P1-6]